VAGGALEVARAPNDVGLDEQVRLGIDGESLAEAELAFALASLALEDLAYGAVLVAGRGVASVMAQLVPPTRPPWRSVVPLQVTRPVSW
jgi:hypothetical protein